MAGFVLGIEGGTHEAIKIDNVFAVSSGVALSTRRGGMGVLEVRARIRGQVLEDQAREAAAGKEGDGGSMGSIVGNKLNCGSGQRPFDREFGWINMDCNPRWEPDVVGDWNDLSMFEDASLEMVVSHHSIEHVGCGEAGGFIKEAWRVLRPRGSLLVFVPDMKALARRWLTGELPDYQYFVNVYGAYMGDEADRHKWGYTGQSLVDELKKAAGWRDVHAFNWRTVAGADIAQDWWILGMEAVK